MMVWNSVPTPNEIKSLEAVFSIVFVETHARFYAEQTLNSLQCELY